MPAAPPTSSGTPPCLGPLCQGEASHPRPLAHGEKVQNNASKLKTFLSFSMEQWPLTTMELEQKWNANPRDLGACRGVGVGTELGDRSLGRASPHHFPSPPCNPRPLGHFRWPLPLPSEILLDPHPSKSHEAPFAGAGGGERAAPAILPHSPAVLCTLTTHTQACNGNRGAARGGPPTPWSPCWGADRTMWVTLRPVTDLLVPHCRTSSVGSVGG